MAYRVEPALLSSGDTQGGIDFTGVRIYDHDRTISDVLQNMNKMDKEIFNKSKATIDVDFLFRGYSNTCKIFVCLVAGDK